MEDTKQMKSKIKTKINAINEKLNNMIYSSIVKLCLSLRGD